ncbi:ATP-binding protein [Kitasatospora sp. GAS1066B]|uniref:ATP-binding protein n=1 Tax=Kitasatospora sp. GAS1066B TaxID=3156271 RepID=UPI0035125D6F
MTARTRLSGRPAALLAALVAVGVAGAAVAVAVVAAPEGERSVVAAWGTLAAAAWCAVALAGLAQWRRARRLAAELATSRTKGEAAVAAVLRAEAATGTALAEAQASRARADAALAEAEAARVEMLAARSEAVEARAEAATARAAADDERAELALLAERTIPEVVRLLRAGASVETVLVAHRQTAHESLVALLAKEVAYGERQRAAALAVCATAAGRMQALATAMHAELREMQHQHGEQVLGDLLRLDHSTAQAGRLADSIAVLTGARSGRRWSRPIPMESVLRGALGRISAYQRVRLHSASGAAVAGYAAEGVMHALAELMDNAANFSAPPAEVHVYVEELHTGLAITVEDGGLGLSEVWLRRAEQAVSGEPLDLTTLSAGTRLGFAVIGALGRKHGLAISFRPSSRGGTGVVMLIPEQLIVHQEQLAQDPGADSATRETVAPASDRPAPAPAPAPALEAEAEPGDGLPRRRRGQTLAAAAAGPSRTARTRSVPTAAARFGDFRQGVQGVQLGQGAHGVPAQPALAQPTDIPDIPKDDA